MGLLDLLETKGRVRVDMLDVATDAERSIFATLRLFWGWEEGLKSQSIEENVNMKDLGGL